MQMFTNGEEGSPELPAYRSHKIVRAARIGTISGIQQPSEHAAILRFSVDAEGRWNNRVVSAEYMAKHNPQVGGYYVAYEDGYESFSPAAAFEAGYTLINAARPASTGLCFGSALVVLKEGLKVARAGWNGKGQWLRRIDLYSDREFRVREIEPCTGTLLPFIAIKTVDNGLVAWSASQADLLATDWEVVP